LYSLYGRTLLWKLATAATVILIGGYNRYRLVPALGEPSARATLIRNVTAECLLLIAVLGWSALLAELHCYCGCDKAEGHQNLIDCYRSTHGASCEICTQEALLAKRMSDQGSPVDQIRNAIRRNFAQDN